MTFWVIYDHLGKLIIVNLLWVLGSVLPILAGLGLLRYGGLAAAGAALVLTLAAMAASGSVLAGLAWLVKQIIDCNDASMRDFVAGWRRFGWRGAGLGLVYFFATVALALSAVFYPNQLSQNMPWLGFALGAMAVWCLLFVWLTALLAWPALVQRNTSTLGAVRLAALLVLSRPGFALGLGIMVLAITGLVAAPPLFVLAYAALFGALVSSGYEMLARHYASVERGEDPQESVRRMMDEDDLLNRGVRDCVFPWKS